MSAVMIFVGLASGNTTLGFNLIPWCIGGLVALLCAYFVWRLLASSTRVLNEIRQARKELSKYDRNAATTNFKEIDQWFQENCRILRHPWLEFREACVEMPTDRGEVRVYNTIDAAHFFPAEDLVDGVLETEVTRHVPGIFTALGIVGTFLGIWMGLVNVQELLTPTPAPTATTSSSTLAVSPAPLPTPSGAASPIPVPTPGAVASPIPNPPPGADSETQSANKVTKATNALLAHVGPAFGASFFAVFLAVVFLALERLRVQAVRAELAGLQVLLDRLFPRKTAEGVLVELLAQSGDQALSVKKLSSDFATEMRPVLDELVRSQAQKMDEANQALITNIAAAIHTKLEPLTDGLVKATSDLKADQSKNATEAIGSLVDRFSSTLTSGAETQVTQLSGTIQSLVSALDVQRTQMAEQQRQMEDYLARVGSTSQGQAQLLEQQVQSLVRQSQLQQDESSRRLEALFERLTTGLAEQAGKASQESNSALSKAGQDLSAMVEDAVRAQQVAAGTLQATLAQMQEGMSQQMTLLVQEVTRSTQSSSASVSQTQDQTAERIAHIMRATQQSIEDNLQRLTQTLHSQSSRHQEESRQLLVSTLDALRKATEELVAQLRAETSGQLGLAAKAISEATEKNAATLSAGTVGEMRRLTEAVDGALGRLSDRMDESVSISSRVSSELLKRFDEQARLLEQQSRQAGEQVTGLAEQASRAAETSKESLSEAGRGIASVIEESIQAQREVSRTLTATMASLKVSVSEQVRILAEQTARSSQENSSALAASSQQSVDLMTNLLEKTRTTTEDGLRDLVQGLQQQMAQHKEESRAALVDTLAALRDATQDLVRNLRQDTVSQLAEATASLRQAAAESQQAMTSSTSEGLGRVATVVDDAMRRLGSRMEALVDSTKTVNEALLQRFGDQAKLLERLTKETNQQVGALTGDLDTAANRVASLLDELAKFADGMRTQILAHREVSGKLLDVSHGLQAAAQSVQAQSTTAQHTTNLLATLSQKLEDQNEKADERIWVLKGLHQNLKELAAALTEGVARQQVAVSDMSQGFDKMKESADNYFGSVVPSLQKALGAFDTQLSKGTSMLGSAVEQMAEPCENIAEILDKLQERLLES